MKITKSEETLMLIIWQKETISMADIIASYPEPKPAKTTIATLLKRLTDKGAISYTTQENKRMYFAKIKKNEISKNRLTELITNYFNNSPNQLASFFTKENKFSKKELEELKAIIDQKIEESD
jgi:predicted transcriptional regulator